MAANLQYGKPLATIMIPPKSSSDTSEKQYQHFKESFFDSSSKRDLSSIGTQCAEFITRTQWQLAQKRKPKETQLQIHNPSLQADGWDSEYTHISIVTKNKPFLIDSVSIALNQLGYSLHHVFHPIFNIVRDSGVLSSVSEHGQEDVKGTNESFMQFVIDKVVDENDQQHIVKTLLAALKDVEYSVNDWKSAKALLKKESESLQASSDIFEASKKEKVINYINWLLNDNFIILGSAVFNASRKAGKLYFKMDEKSRSGILKSQHAKSLVFDFTKKQPEFLRRIDDVLILSKSTLRSTVHRSAYCDTVSLKRYDDKGNILSELRFWGLYTSTAYRDNPVNIPVIQDKIDYVFKHSKLSTENHKGKALMHTLVTYPRDELLSIRSKDLARFALDITELSYRQHVSVYMRSDYYQRYISCLIYVPRDSYSQDLRERVAGKLMQVCDVDHYDYLIKIADEAFVRLEMLVMLDEANANTFDLDKISADIKQAAKTWDDHLQTQLVSENGVIKGNILFDRYKNALSATYKNECQIESACEDLAMFESMSVNHAFDLRVEAGQSKTQFNVRLFNRDAFIAPSDTMPVFNNMGVRVLFEKPYEVQFKDAAGQDVTVYIHDYTLEYKEGFERTYLLDGEFKQSFVDVWHQQVENDGLNKLMLSAALTSREIVVFRTIAKYLQQACLPFSQQYIEQTLIDNQAITKKILDLFECRFNPELNNKKEQAATQRKVKRLITTINAALDQVASLDQDRILRNILSVVHAVVRTNFYQNDESDQQKPYVSIKLDTREVLELPDPRPMFEIFVYSPKTEGVHLRGGKVARGGLRWSDRREDFRTEVLGLMKAQMVKNSVIVPVGAKGGFVMKQLPIENSREALMNEVVSCYRTFINALLDVTDNVIKGKIIPPRDVVRHDEDDSYLVVAADKGTATFSDIANEIAISRNFWLGDAFASGGSIGYDHKKMGITARGAWESVKLNFRDLGKDIQKEDFTAVGIGDMGGDVFGNGMLLSKHTCLVAAFNHMHIFIDPNPDAASSYKERKRLFNLPRSSWEDYKKELISKGGGIYSRSDKVIKLSQAARKALDIKEEELSPEQLINRILKSPVDLLWNGGIGTYIKASYEQNNEVGDKANDGLRVNGEELRCLCVGEGGNLGVTQQGRIEFALNGGSIDTDFIHNAGGVDCSDHEVNIKILLHKLLESGDLTEARRVKLLESMTDDVAKVVLLSNYWQGQAITQVEQLGAAKIDEQTLYIRELERIGRLDRSLEGLPDDEAIHQRKLDGKGLVRPEIAVLVSYAKLTGYDSLLESDLWNDEYFANELHRYFPKELVSKFKNAVTEHPLRKEILSTFIINRMVNRMGPTFAFKMQQEMNASISDVARAYTIAWEAFGLRHLWQAISDLDNKVEGALQTEMMLTACELIEKSSRWLIQHRRKRLGIRDTINDYEHGAQALRALLPKLYEGELVEGQDAATTVYTQQGVPETVAVDIVAMDDFYCTFDIVEIANKAKVAVEKVSKVYFYIYKTLDVKALRDMIDGVSVDNHWQERNQSALIDDLYATQRAICEKVIASDKSAKKSTAINKVYTAWAEANAESIQPYENCVAEFKMADNLDMSMLSVAVRLLDRVAK